MILALLQDLSPLEGWIEIFIRLGGWGVVTWIVKSMLDNQREDRKLLARAVDTWTDFKRDREQATDLIMKELQAQNAVLAKISATLGNTTSIQRDMIESLNRHDAEMRKLVQK